MSLRCLLFSSDEGTAQPIRQVLADLDIDGEYCSVAAGTAERVSSQPFHLVIVDWDDQPDAGVLLQAARERKAAERPLTLAIVKDDASVSQALQAGANSILRRPILPDQVRDTLIKARDLLKAKLEPPPPLGRAVAASPGIPAQPASAPPEIKQTLRSEILHRGSATSAQFDTESDAPKSFDHNDGAQIDALKDLEPVAAPVEKAPMAAEPPSRREDEPHGLSWYLKGRAGTAPPPAAPKPPTPTQPELLTYSSMSSQGESSRAKSVASAPETAPSPEQRAQHEQKTEAQLFAYMAGEPAENPEQAIAPPRPWLRKVALLGALLVIGGAAYARLPRALWSQNLRILLAYVTRAGHGWLNPQPVTPVQAPVSHENFGRAGDEYKLPVAENIPDATTDPSQIRVLPVIDPTAKQPNGGAANGGQVATAQSPSTEVPGAPNPTGSGGGSDRPPSTPIAAQENQASQSAPPAIEPAGNQSQSSLVPPTTTSAVPADSSRPDPFAAPSGKPPALVIVPPTVRTSVSASVPAHRSTAAAPGIPSSLKSQMVANTSAAGGNKPVESAMPSIEPVELPEAIVRALLLEQPEPAYPASAKGRQGTVTLQVLIGRDGTVQDSKFLQGSLVFAHVAVDAVKQWRFKPYVMNGRPVSVQTLLTLAFKPAS